MTNRTRRLYIGVTSDLQRRVYEHKHRLVPGFTSKYFLQRLVYVEDTNDVAVAIAREESYCVADFIGDNQVRAAVPIHVRDQCGRWKATGRILHCGQE